jgi:NADPH-dependent 2,4-dienoyl-CoA reductase/sulfur reductase-like enzyme
MAEALTTRGLHVTVVEQMPQVLSTVDAELGDAVAGELRLHGVQVYIGTPIRAVDAQDEQVVLRGDDGFRVRAGLVLVVTGVRPDTALADAAGIALAGPRKAIAVDRHMGTNLPDVYAAGDCVVTHHRLLGDSYLPLGTTAHKQGRVAGENAVGGDRQFGGSLGTQVVQVFDLVAARTGLHHSEAAEAGFEPATTETAADDHKRYYPDARTVRVRLTADRHDRRLLGVQILGAVPTAVAKRIDTAAAALYAGLTVDDLIDLDLSYTPPLGTPWDVLQKRCTRLAASAPLSQLRRTYAAPKPRTVTSRRAARRRLRTWR